MEISVLLFMRILAAIVFAAGAVWLAYDGKEGWGWCVFAAIVLGGVTFTSKSGD